MQQEIELLKAKIRVLELEIEMLKMQQGHGAFIVYPTIEPWNPYPLNPPQYPYTPWTC